MNSDLETIKNRLNIVDIIGQYLKLEKAGSNWRACCPFHNEKTPSFMVSEEKQIFHCFGCQKGGDIFSFVMEMEGVEFREALQILADKAGVKLQKYTKNPEKEKQKNRTMEILELSTKFYEYCLWKSDGGKKIQTYLKERGIIQETMQRFRLGYAPNGWRNILNFLVSKGYNENEIEKTGLLVRKESGGFYDRFRSRVIFPIADTQGRIVGFSARVTPGQNESQAKYVNTPETEVYHKSNILFGLDKAKMAIKQKDEVVLVEGNMDVVAASQAGIKNIVAVSGTALTQEQIKIIKRYTQNVKMFFDMDEAGEKATRKSLKLCFQEGINPSIITLSQGKDAADIAKENPQELLKNIENAKGSFEYLFERAFLNFKKNDVKQKKEIAQSLTEMISYLESDLEKNHWIKVLSEKLETREEILTEMLKKAILESSNYVSSQENEPEKEENRDKLEILTDKILGLSFACPDVWEKVVEKEEIFAINISENFKDFSKGKEFDFDFKKFLDTLDNLNLKKKAVNLFSQEKYQMSLSGKLEEKSDQSLIQEAQDYLKQFRVETINRELEKITKDLKTAQERNDKETQNFLREEFQEMAKRKSDLEKN